ncbi:DJ-1/PfpI family protein [Bacillus sp. 31A1R]|uniref:DJ-1/PfpI family protein n=1 Tax=Robertmurraya mangrovi TaxID=3098077 RepID=A0ABU5IVR8_9BACI|nr:DJ-1/PfpI family protein [Bacillus sp. 31A1R]MDZ5471258.1 DJ-1/PfpI family protein [Bacillus sp. 31A1R]
MKVHILIYDNYAHFEVDLIGWIKSREHEIVTVSLQNEEIKSVEGFIVKAQKRLDDLNPTEVEAFIVAGGDAESIVGNERLRTFLRELNNRQKLIASICYGPLVLADAGILNERTFTTSVTEDLELFNAFDGGTFHNTTVVIDDHIVTAKGTAYVEFSVAICKKLNLTSESHLEHWTQFFSTKKEFILQ